MLRAPFSLEKTAYDAARGAVIYRSRLHATLKRNFQVMPGVEWLELLCKHIPDRHEHMVRYYGRYSSRTRGSEHERPDMDGPGPEAESQARGAAKVAWAKMIRKVYEVDPLACPEIGAFASALSGFRLHQSISSTMFGIGQTCLVAGLACRDARIDPRQGRFSRRPDKRWRGSALSQALGVPLSVVQAWMRSEAPIPERLFARLLDMIVEDNLRTLATNRPSNIDLPQKGA